jgi:glucokinase
MGRESVVTDLIGDIGGTNARFALVDNGSVYEIENLRGSDHATFQDAIQAYLTMVGLPRVRTAAFAFAGPITGDQAKLTNRPQWNFSTEELRKSLGFERLTVVNDFYANALALPALESNDLFQVGTGEPQPLHNKMVLGPGSGLGVAIVAWDGASWLPLPGEGGHARVPMGQTPREDALLARMRDRFGYVSIEHLLSGGGLTNLYDAILKVDGRADPIPEQHAITASALSGSDPVAVEVVDLFLSFLGSVAGNLALTAMAKGGVYIAGGIVPAMPEFAARSHLRACFEGASKMKYLLEPIPTYIITNEHPAFVGLQSLLPGKRGASA